LKRWNIQGLSALPPIISLAGWIGWRNNRVSGGGLFFIEGRVVKRETMRVDGGVEELVCSVAEFDRSRCVDALRSIAWPPLDFSAEYLESQTLDRLRHLVMAAMLRAR
jgi:hypothetical protein